MSSVLSDLFTDLAVMHILMGSQNDVFDELFKDISEEDKKQVEFKNVDETKVEKLEKLEERRMELEEELD